MSIKDKAKNMMLASFEKVEKATGKALGNEEMPVKDQVEEVKVHLKNVGERVRGALKKED